jgi:hypothetical protein
VLLLDVSTLQRPVLNLDVYTQQGPELHLDMSGQQEPVLLLDMSTPQGLDLHLDVSTQQGPEWHWDMSGQQEPVLLLDVSTPQVLELHIDVSIPQRPVLLLDVSGQQEPVLRIEQIKKMFFFLSTNNLNDAENCFKGLYIFLMYLLFMYTLHVQRFSTLHILCTNLFRLTKKHLKMTFRDFLGQNMLTEQLLLVIITVGCVWRALFWAPEGSGVLDFFL